jgi:hypothetical protein
MGIEPEWFSNNNHCGIESRGFLKKGWIISALAPQYYLIKIKSFYLHLKWSGSSVG